MPRAECVDGVVATVAPNWGVEGGERQTEYVRYGLASVP